MLKSSMIVCIDDIKCWLACNRLKLNPAKFKFSWSVTARCLHLVDNSIFHFEDGHVTPSTTVRNPGVFFYTSCSMGPHTDRLVRPCCVPPTASYVYRQTRPCWVLPTASYAGHSSLYHIHSNPHRLL